MENLFISNLLDMPHKSQQLVGLNVTHGFKHLFGNTICFTGKIVTILKVFHSSYGPNREVSEFK